MVDAPLGFPPLRFRRFEGRRGESLAEGCATESGFSTRPIFGPLSPALLAQFFLQRVSSLSLFSSDGVVGAWHCPGRWVGLSKYSRYCTGVDYLNRMPRGRKKENIPPLLSRYATSAIGSNRGEVTAQGRQRDASTRNRSNDPQLHRMVQTNLACPYWPFRDATSDSLSQQQSNLVSELQRGRSGRPGLISNTCPPPAVHHSHRSCSGHLGLKGNPPSNFSSRRCDVPRACNAISKNRMGNKDQYGLKQPLGHFSASRSSCGHFRAHGGSFSAANLSGMTSPGSLHHSCHSTSSNRSHDSFPPGPALTLDHLSSSPFVESPPSSTALKTLLQSSQMSANQHRSIQRLKQEAALMGALGSFPWESKSPSLPSPLRFHPQASTSAVLSIMGQLAAEESHDKQAGVKWRTSFARDWGLTSTVGALGDGKAIPVVYRCRNTGLCMYPTEASDQCWQAGFCGSAGLTSLALRGEDGYSNTSVGYLECCSGGKGTCGCPKTLCHQRTIDPEEHSSGVFCRSELRFENHPLGLLSFDGLAVSLETLCAETEVDMGLSVYDTKKEVHTIRSPGGLEVVATHQFGNGSKSLESRGEPEDDSGSPLITNSEDEYTLCLPRQKPSPFGVQEHFQAVNRIGMAVVGGSTSDSPDSMSNNYWPGVKNDQGEELSVEETKKWTVLPCRKESDSGVNCMQKKGPARDDRLMDRSDDRSLPQRSDPLVEKCFMAWRDHISRKTAAAWALYEHQLLRKGLCALQWAVQLREVQAGVAERNHTLVVLAASFRRWQDVAARQWKAQASRQQEAVTHSEGLLAPPGGERVRNSPISCQLSAEHLENAAQYSRAEGLLWVQLHRRQGANKLCRKTAAVRDVRRLAAAFRLWHLQKEHLDKEEIRAQDAHTLLEKKRLEKAFGTWRSCYRANQRILPLAALVQRGLMSRCFKAWKCSASREALRRYSLECLRVASLSVHFRQWALMVQVREKARETLLELWTLKRRRAHVKLGLAANVPAEKLGLNVARWSQKNGTSTLESLCNTLTLQQAFWTWKARWQESQQATAFQRVLERQQLREALGRWCWKTFCLHPLGLSPRDLTEDPLLTSLDLEESSLSSGFHSSMPAPPVSRGSLEKEGSPGDGSQASISSSVTIEDCRLFPHHDSPSPSCAPRGPKDLADAAIDFHIQVPMDRCYMGRKYLRLWRYHVVLRHFQGEREKRHLARAWLVWKDSCRTELALQALARQGLAQRSWQIWRRRCLQSWVAERFLEAEERQLLEQAFGRWRQLTASCAESKANF
ncbi:uncharacterized protein LOC133372896 isoform X2 [Rhineura floridana]|uniref:uncharacterized protein LOC133372896 isoform X2 n=1 Tax=Rhineura floridana TaxID=261503 RepID=UPI002AC810A9|nr:uncharacterized protein LOC133372896 isoform X2 [Rhineura floridana]